MFHEFKMWKIALTAWKQLMKPQVPHLFILRFSGR